MEKKKLSKLLLVAFIIGIAYLVYSLWYWTTGVDAGTNAAEQIGTGIATIVVLPHLLCTAFAVLFNGIGLFMRRRGFALAGAILYTVALVLFPIYFIFVIIEAVLSYIGFARMKNQ